MIVVNSASKHPYYSLRDYVDQLLVMGEALGSAIRIAPECGDIFDAICEECRRVQALPRHNNWELYLERIF